MLSKKAAREMRDWRQNTFGRNIILKMKKNQVE